MALAVLRKSNIGKLVAAVNKNGSFLAPVAGDDGVVLSAVNAGDTLVYEYANFKLPPKRYFFPQREPIGAYEREAGWTDAPAAPQGTVVLFGLRPCDCRAVKQLDRVFLEGVAEDPPYAQRRRSAVIVALACASPRSTCFCTATGGDPASAAGADVLAFDLGDRLLLESHTTAGQGLLERHGRLLERATDKDLAQKEKLAGVHAQSDVGSDLRGSANRLNERFSSAVWGDVSACCLGCGACTFLCPTCHCFSFADEERRGTAVRSRCHDACMFASFVREASGHNPRGPWGERLRQRMMHKFCYSVENSGEAYCVGCGRCVQYCPSNIDLRQVMAEVTR